MTKLITISWVVNGGRRISEKRATTDKLARIIAGSIASWDCAGYRVSGIEIDGVAL